MSGVFRKLGPETARVLGAALKYRVNPVSAAKRYLSLYRDRRFSPDEIHFLRLLDPSLSANDLTQVVSKEELVTLQRRLNPAAFHQLTEDKLRFHERCLEAGLPVPEIYALYGSGATHGFRLLGNERDLQDFLDDPPAQTFIVKPVDGVHGDGVTRLTKEAGEWKDHHGTSMTARRVVTHVEISSYDRWMLQEVITGHPDLRALTGAEGLQTIRAVTVTDGNHRVDIVAARLRLISGDTVHDNFDYGRTGNLIANLDVDEGTIRSVIGGAGEPRSIYHVTRHPRTGKTLLGHQVPHWQEARKLVQDAATAFAPLRTIGWDVAITAERPCLIEGNVTWDTLTGEPRMGDIYRHMQALSV